MITITKRELRTRLGFEYDSELAAFFQISAAAVSAWDENSPVPERRALQAALKHPELIAPDGSAPANDAEDPDAGRVFPPIETA